jgi:hypothetical protein
MTLLLVLTVLALVGRLALVAIAARALLTAVTYPPGRLRRRHAVLGVVVLVGALVRF